MQTSKLNISNLIKYLRKKGEVIFLESQMTEHPSSSVSYIAALPEFWIKAQGTRVEYCDRSGFQVEDMDPWEALQSFRSSHPDWMFGYLGYDLKNSIEQLECSNPSLLDAPDLYFMVPGLLLEVHMDGLIEVIKGEIPEEGNAIDDKKGSLDISLDNKISKKAYIETIEKAKNDIYEGSYYEINLSHPLQFALKGDSWDLYEAMKQAGPVPFAGYAHFENFSICCSSPERFLSRQGNKVWSQPIKGTASRVRGEDADLDGARLKESEKERAENLMIVDLVRNDLSRIAANNSVKVSRLFEIQSFETVHQMVSTVECELREGLSSMEVIRSCFPMGSMTGAPKIASMKAIEQYETYKRGVYSGALGYFKPNDDFDFNVIIRTALVQGEKLIYPVGGAITSDSDPEQEWEETMLKARAITNIFDKIN